MIVIGGWVTIDGWLSGPAEKIYRWISQDEVKRTGGKMSNSMRLMREAFGLPLGNEHIQEWLEYWDSLTQDQRVELRRMDLSTLSTSKIPQPPTKENA